jgi:class 3 adenylate cyclase
MWHHGVGTMVTEPPDRMMPDEPSPMLERKLATILSADVAGYSRLMAEDEEQTLRIFRGHREVFESVVAMHRGRIFNTAGDAILAEFPSAVDAVRCATEIQTAVRTRNDQFPEARQVKFRIGVNLGDVMVQGGDLLGDGVNVAARLQAAAEPGGICISGSVYDQIRNKLSLSFRSLGERSFKNIPQPVRTFSIAETEDHGALPVRKRGFSKIYKWATAAVLFVLIVGGGYWAYSSYHRGIVAARRDSRATIERAEIRAQVEETLARDARASREAELAREQAAADARRRDVETRRTAEMQRQGATTGSRDAVPTDGARPAVVAPPPPPAGSPGAQGTGGAPSGPAVASTSGPPGAGSGATNITAVDGMYAGPVCWGDSPRDPARCFRAQAAVSQGKITGQWPGRDPGVTMYLWGDVSAAGDVTIRMQTRRADGYPMATVNLTGTLRDGHLDATGTFVGGRTAQLNWRKN